MFVCVSPVIAWCFLDNTCACIYKTFARVPRLSWVGIYFFGHLRSTDGLFPSSESCPIHLFTWSGYHCYFSLCLNACQSLDLASCCKIWTPLGHFPHDSSLRGQEEILFWRWSASRAAWHLVPVTPLCHPHLLFPWFPSSGGHFLGVLIPSFPPFHHHLTETEWNAERVYWLWKITPSHMANPWASDGGISIWSLSFGGLYFLELPSS